jgi:hypothetical protein
MLLAEEAKFFFRYIKNVLIFQRLEESLDHFIRQVICVGLIIYVC